MIDGVVREWEQVLDCAELIVLFGYLKVGSLRDILFLF